MQYANIMVALAGERDNTVPKYGVSAAEIAVLRAIHGDESIHDVEPVTKDLNGEKFEKVSNRDELRRLKDLYAGPNTTPKIEQLFPGAFARVPESIDELELADEAFKPKEREKAPPAEKSAAEATDRERRGPTRRPAKDEKGSASANETTEADADGIKDMPDVTS